MGRPLHVAELVRPCRPDGVVSAADGFSMCPNLFARAPTGDGRCWSAVCGARPPGLRGGRAPVVSCRRPRHRRRADPGLLPRPRGRFGPVEHPGPDPRPASARRDRGGGRPAGLGAGRRQLGDPQARTQRDGLGLDVPGRRAAGSAGGLRVARVHGRRQRRLGAGAGGVSRDTRNTGRRTVGGAAVGTRRGGPPVEFGVGASARG